MISKKAVQDIDLWFNGRLAINLIEPTFERMLVSKARVPEFKYQAYVMEFSRSAL